MGNLLRIIQCEENPPIQNEQEFGNSIMNDLQQTLECLKMLKKDSQPICMTHKREVIQICLYERCREKERFLCSICLIRSHTNHEEHFVSIDDFKRDLLTYINERREERTAQLNQVKKQVQQSSRSTPISNQYLKGQSNEIGIPNKISNPKSSSNSNYVQDSFIKQLKKKVKLSEQFILEEIVNDIDNLIDQVRQLKRNQNVCKESSKKLVEFREEFSNIIKSFIERKNLVQAKLFWSQHDLINEIHSGILSNSQLVESIISKNSFNQNQQQLLTQQNQSGVSQISQSSEYNNSLMNQNQKKKKHYQPFLSLIKLFESSNHIINNNLAKKPFGEICPIIYINSNYCLIPFSTSFNVDSLALYDLKNCKLVKVQRVSFYPNYLIDNIIYFGFPQLVEHNIEQQNTEVYHLFINHLLIQDIQPTNVLLNMFENIESPTIHQSEITSFNQQSNQSQINQNNVIQIIDSDEQQENNALEMNLTEIDQQEDSEQQIESPLYYSYEQIDNIPNQLNNIDKNNIHIDVESQDISQNSNLNKGFYLSNQLEELSTSKNNYNQIDEYNSINQFLPTSQLDLQNNNIESFSPIREDYKILDEQDSELQNLQRLFSQKQSSKELNKNKKGQKCKPQKLLNNPKKSFKFHDMEDEAINLRDQQQNQMYMISEQDEFQSICSNSDRDMIAEQEESVFKGVQAQNNRNKSKQRKNTFYEISSDSENCMLDEQNFMRNNNINSNKLKPNSQQQIKNHNQAFQKQNTFKSNQKEKWNNQKQTQFESQNESDEIEEVKIIDQDYTQPTHNQYQQKNPILIDLDKSSQSINDINNDPNMNQMNNNEQIFCSASNVLQQNRDQYIDRDFITIDSQSESQNFIPLEQNQQNFIAQQQQLQQQQLVNQQENFQQIFEPQVLHEQFFEEFQEQEQIPQVEFNVEMLDTSAMDYSQFVSSKQHATPLLQKVSDNKVFQIKNKNNIIFYKLNLQNKEENSNIISKDMVIKTKGSIKNSFMLSQIIMCVCERKPARIPTDSVSFYNIKTKKIIKRINNVGFYGEYINSLRLGKGNNIICYKTSDKQFIIQNWQTSKEIKRFKMKEGISFENMRIFIEFYYHMYKDLDFEEEKVYLQICDKILQYTNFSENYLQYCIPYQLIQKNETPQIGVCYFQNKILKSITFNIENMEIQNGISQLYISNDQLIIILKSGEIHHFSLKTLVTQNKNSKQQKITFHS